MSVIQGTFIPVVHSKSGALVATEISPMPPEAEIIADCGLMAIDPAAPPWVTIAKAPPTEILPHRGDMLVFGATVKLRLPLPVPAPVELRPIQETEAAL